MQRQPASAVLAAAVGGVLHLIVIFVPYHVIGYQSVIGLDFDQMVGLFVLGAIAGGLLGYTRLIVPAVGLVALVSGVLAYELVWSQPTRFGELNGHTIIGIDADPYLYQYVRTWLVWIPILLAGGIAEFGVRGGYGIGEEHLRNLPAFPLSPKLIVGLAGGCALFFGVATYVVMVQMGTQAPYQQQWGFVGGFTMVAVVLGGVLSRGLLTPVVIATHLIGIGTLNVLVVNGEAAALGVMLFFAPILGGLVVFEWAIRYRLFDQIGGRKFIQKGV